MASDLHRRPIAGCYPRAMSEMTFSAPLLLREVRRRVRVWIAALREDAHYEDNVIDQIERRAKALARDLELLSGSTPEAGNRAAQQTQELASATIVDGLRGILEDIENPE